jgi:heme oxygenase
MNGGAKSARRMLLKQATGTLHDTLEASEPFASLSAEHFSLPCYIDVLSCLWGFYSRVELQLRDYVADLPICAGRFKTHLLEADLKALHQDPGSLPQYPGLIAIDGWENALGVWYVFEGATLGGSMLLPIVSKALGSNVSATHFYGVYGEERGAKWREFCRYLEAVELRDESALVAGAERAFRGLLRWVQEK